MSRRLRERDLAGPALVLAALVVFLLHGFDNKLSRDLGIYAYGAQQVAEGVPPYVSVLNRAGPLAHLVPGVGVIVGRIVGLDDVFAMRLLMMLLSLVCVALIYRLGREVFATRAAGVVAAVTLVCFQGFMLYATGGPREKTTMLLLLLLTLLAAHRKAWFTAGVAVALATLTWQPVFVTGLAAVVVALPSRDWRSSLRGLVRFVLGGVVATALVVGGFALAGALDEFLDGFLLINLRYTQQPGIEDFLELAPEAMREGFGWSLPLLLGGTLAILVLGVVALVRRGQRLAVLPAAAAALGAGLWSLKAFNGWADAFPLLPPAALGVAGLAAEAWRHLPRPAGRPLLALLAVAGLVGAGVNARVTHSEELVQQREELDAIMALAPDNATITSIGGPQALVLLRMRNPTQHQMFLTGLGQYVDDTWPGGLAGFVAGIEEDQPTFLSMDRSDPFEFIDPVVDRGYKRLGWMPGFILYANRSLGREKIAEMRAVVASYPRPDG